MIRVVGLVLTGAVLGIVGAALYPSSDFNPGADGSLRADGAAGIQPAPNAFQTRLAAYERVSSAPDADALAARIEAAAAGNATWQRNTEISALLARLVATDPRRAVRLAESFALGNDVLAGLFRTWADADPDAAIAALESLALASSRRAAALALLDVVGFAEADIEVVAAALPRVEGNNFRLDAIALFAEQDLPGALERALQLEVGQASTAAAQQIAAVMARSDPQAALAYENMIPVPIQRIRYRDRVFDEWAKTDPAAMLAYLESTSDLTEVLVGEAGFQALATSAPEKLFIVADRFAASQRARAQAAAIDVLATIDPVAAYERVSALPATNERDGLVETVAARYAEQDSEAALAWATTLEPRSAAALHAVLSNLAAADPGRAVDLVIGDILDPVASNRMDTLSVAAVLAGPMDEASDRIPGVADKLAAHGDPRVRTQLDALLVSWSQRDAGSALDWTLLNTDALRGDAAASLARNIAGQDIELAREGLPRLPTKLRSPWISGVASAMAEQDLPGAQRWVLSLPSGPARDPGLGNVLQRAASTGSVEARLLDAFSSDAARERALASAMFQLGTSDPQLGRRLIEEYIGDPELRQVAEQELVMGERRGDFPF